MNSSDQRIASLARSMTNISRRGWGRAQCPFCDQRKGSPDKRKSFGINFNTGECHCFRCRARGQLDLGTLGYAPAALNDTDSGEPEDFYLGAPESFMRLGEEPGRSSEILRSARRYLARRNLTMQVIREAGIGACSSGRQAGRIIVPITAPDGTWLGWSGRIWAANCSPKIPKYIYPEGLDRYTTMFNSAALSVRTSRPVLIVEGVFDALAWWPDATAVLGKPAEGQIEQLVRTRRPIVVALDGDAWIEGEALALRLQLEGVPAGWVRLPPKEDPATVARPWMEAAAIEALRQ